MEYDHRKRRDQHEYHNEQKRNGAGCSCQGRLDTISSPELEEQLEPAPEGIEKLIFDFAGVKYISGAGSRVLLTAMQVMEEQGEMIVRNVRPAVMEVFEVTGFIDDLNIE